MGKNVEMTSGDEMTDVDMCDPGHPPPRWPVRIQIAILLHDGSKIGSQRKPTGACNSLKKPSVANPSFEPTTLF